MKQAPVSCEPASVAPVAEGGLEPIDLAACSATVDDGLLMVFGPDGDPLPPEGFEQAALAEPGRVMLVDGTPVPVERIVTVLRSQRLGRLAPAGGDAWLRSMLGLGPAPEEALSEELAADGRLELIRFGQEVVITTRANEVFLLRAARPDDEEPGVRIRDGAGRPLGHEGLLEAVASDPADDGQATGSSVEPDGEGIVLDFAPARLRLERAEPGEACSIPCAVSGEAVEWRVLASALLGAPVGWNGAPPEADGRGTAEAEKPQVGGGGPMLAPPGRLVFDDQGFVKLGWLEKALAAAGDRATGIRLTGLPAAVRLSAGAADGDGWRVPVDQVADLAMFATPEGLQSFTLEIEVEGAPDGPAWSIPVLPTGEDEGKPAADQPLTVALDFPPPFSARNRLDYFAVVMIEGLPPGASLSAGVPSGGRRWTLAPADLRGLRAHLPAGVRLPCALEITGITIENQEGMLSSARRTLVIGAPAEPPEGEPTPAVAAIDLRPLLEAAGSDRRVDAVALTGLPPVVALSAGTRDSVSGCWVLRSSELSELTMTVGDPALRRLSLRARAIVIDRNGGATAISHALEVEIPEAAAADLQPVSSGPGFFRSLAQRRA